MNTSSYSEIFNQGGNAWNLLDFDNQSAAFFFVDTIKYDSIPNVPSRLEGVKTRPERDMKYIDYCYIQEMSLSLVGEKSHVERGNQISEMARLMRTEKKKLAVDFSEVRLRPET